MECLKTLRAYQVDDLAEMHLDAALCKVGVVRGVMDQLRKLALPHLGRTVTEDEEQCVDGVGLAGPIGADDGRERLRRQLVSEC